MEILEVNAENRPISQLSVIKYKTDFLSGRWDYNAEPLKFSWDGLLRDGQHRMIALSQCPPKTRVKFLVAYGLNPESQLSMDQGRVRTAGNQLSLRGVKEANLVAAGAKTFILWDEGLLFRDNNAQAKITKSVVEEFVFNNLPQIKRLGEYTSLIKKNHARGAIAYAAALGFDSVQPDYSRAFFDQLANGAANARNNPITALDKRLANEKGVFVSNRNQLSYFIVAWNKWINGTKTSTIRIKNWTANDFPQIAIPKPVRA